jgi:hypothetical protein
VLSFFWHYLLFDYSVLNSQYLIFSQDTPLATTGGFRQKQQRLIDDGRWTLAGVSDRFQPMPKGEPEIYHNVWAYLVSG